MTSLFLCLLHGGNIVNKKEYLRIKLNWRSEKYFGFSLESTMGSHIPRYISCIVHRSYRHLNLLSDIFTITQCDKRLRLWNAKCMRRYKTHFKKFSCQGKKLVTGSQRLSELLYLCMKVCHEVQFLTNLSLHPVTLNDRFDVVSVILRFISSCHHHRSCRRRRHHHHHHRRHHLHYMIAKNKLSFYISYTAHYFLSSPSPMSPPPPLPSTSSSSSSSSSSPRDYKKFLWMKLGSWRETTFQQVTRALSLKRWVPHVRTVFNLRVTQRVVLWDKAVVLWITID